MRSRLRSRGSRCSCGVRDLSVRPGCRGVRGRRVRDGRWPRHAGRELRGSTLGIIGYGPSGRAVAHLTRAFGMSVTVHTAHPTDS
ncbi:NAD(P)-dependent oxidoreductase [Rhodococcus opacus]|uniref:D-isomer specific 2-hydroxyacid dehydrogenase NAD-binding domain-containing protein n=1 Tax=Rhodococcus opacus (strain B4) TaxID=632772 RepID=C1AZV1_RHOOB|nr:NAD(P)-dependent oxidoreductase [Rhodococcus opacus]BAH54372.1 hypothetical protein ROP_61250 [Rhodococcus opacus B4]